MITAETLSIAQLETLVRSAGYQGTLSGSRPIATGGSRGVLVDGSLSYEGRHYAYLVIELVEGFGELDVRIGGEVYNLTLSVIGHKA